MRDSSIHAAELLVRVVPQVMRVIAGDVRRAGLDIEPIYIHLLALLSEREMSLGELADKFAVSRPTMSRTVSTLETRGWIQRRRGEGDRRVVHVGLRAEGRSILARAKEYMVMRVAETLETLGDAERERLSRGLDDLAEAFAHAFSKEGSDGGDVC